MPDLQPLQQLLQNNLDELFLMFDGMDSIRVHSSSAEHYGTSNIPFSFFNSVSRFLLPPAAKTPKAEKDRKQELEKRIRLIKRLASDKGVPILWWLGPDESEAELFPYLRRVGFEYADDLVGMHLDLHTIDQEEQLFESSSDAVLSFQPLQTVQDENDWTRIVSTVFDLPNMYGNYFIPASKRFNPEISEKAGPYAINYLLKRNDEAIATLSLLCAQETVGLYNIAVLPQYRGQRLASMMTHAGLGHAKQLGYGHAVLQATRSGLSIYRRLGFTEEATFSRLQWFPPGYVPPL